MFMPVICIEAICPQYPARRLVAQDLPQVYKLCQGNTTFYEYNKESVTLAAVEADFTALPPGIALEDKYYLGFYQQGSLVALLDVIAHYPRAETAHIGLFMVEQACQGQGLGREIIGGLLRQLRCAGFARARLGCIVGNKEGEAFWQRMGFVPTGELSQRELYTVAVYQQNLEELPKK